MLESIYTYHNKLDKNAKDVKRKIYPDTTSGVSKYKALYIAALSFITFLLLLLCLWQIKRYYYKEDLIIQYKINSTKPIISNCNEIDWNNLEKFYFRKVKLTKEIDKKTYKNIYKNVFDQKNKKYLIDEYCILKCNEKLIIADNKMAEGEIIPLPRKNYFYPSNQPEKGLWYNFDQQTISNYLNKEVENFYLNNKNQKHNIDNIHLSYAITWGMLFLFGLWMIRKA
jgi:cytochrome oxidase assembly protein ShyY1